MLEQLQNKEQAINKARSLIETSKIKIFATMNLTEELIDPLPDWYYQLMLDKLNKGIKITRVAFGSQGHLSRFSSTYPELSNHQNYQVSLHDMTLHQYYRMLLIDESKLMFAPQIPYSRIFLYTDEKELIETYRNYFVSFL